MIKGIGGIHSYTNSGGRSSNEDGIQVLTTENRVRVLAADGIGGEAGGGIAASAALLLFPSRYARRKSGRQARHLPHVYSIRSRGQSARGSA